MLPPLLLDSLGRLPPPSPAPPEPVASVASALADIRKAIQSARPLQSPGSGTGPGSTPDPWLPRGGGGEINSEPPPPPPPALASPLCHTGPPSPACSTPPPPPPVELHDGGTESEPEEERVPTPEVMRKEEEDLDTDQVIKDTRNSHTGFAF